jgi:hypothetical protein
MTSALLPANVPSTTAEATDAASGALDRGDTIQGVRESSKRASDEDRERVARVLQGHAVAGRLTTDELDERIGGAFGARTLRELDVLLSDLPRERRLAPRTVLTLLLQGIVMLLVGVVIVTIAILLALAWAGSRLVAAVAARSLDSRRVQALRAGP